MFPDFRLMIAAAFASVVALVCGFGVFATVHVSHAPLVRMPPALALLQQLRADNAVTLPITALEPFEHRFRLGEPATRAGISALAYAAIQPNEQPVIRAVMPLADDQDHEAAVHEPLPLPVDGEDAPAPAHQAAIADAAPDAKPDPDADATIGAEAPPSAPSVATIEPATTEPATEQARPAEQTSETEIALASPMIEPAQPTLETAINVEEKKAKHKRLAAKSHRMRRARASVFATTQSFKQNLTYSATTFETAPQAWPPQAQKQPVRGQRPKTTVEAPVDSGSAMGGPFVSAPSR